VTPKRWAALVVLLIGGGARCLAGGLPDGVVISRAHGLIMTEKAIESLPPWKWDVLSVEKRTPGTRNDRIVYSSRNVDPDADLMHFTPVCVFFQDWVRYSRTDLAITGGRWKDPEGAVMPANGCMDQAIYVTRSQYEQLGGPSYANAERNWYLAKVYPAVKAFVYTRTFPSKNPSPLWGKWTPVTIARAVESNNYLMDLRAEFHFDLAKFIEGLAHLAPGVSTIEAASKYGFYSTKFYAAAGVDASLILIPIGRLGKGGKLVAGTLMAGTVGISAYNFLNAETDQEKLQAVLDIVLTLTFAHDALRQIKPKVGLKAPDNLPERALFEDLAGEAAAHAPVNVGCRILGPTARDISVAGVYPTPLEYMTKGLEAIQDEGLKAYIKGSTRYQKLLAIIEKNPQFFHWKDDLPPLVSAEIASDGHIYMRSTVRWERAYVNLWHEVAHTEIYAIPFITNKSKFAAAYGMSAKDFIKANMHLLDEETFVWVDCAMLVKDLEDHGAKFVTAGGADVAASEHKLLDLIKDGPPVTRSWQEVRRFLWKDLDYEDDIGRTLTNIYNGQGIEGIDLLDGTQWRRRLGQPPY
jgi:hypothetical protein